MVWCSMPRRAAEYALKFCEENPVFLKTLKHVAISEEFFFQSIFMTSDFRKFVVNDNLRYTDWTERYGSSPAFLDETDYESIIESECIFARKVDTEISKELIKKVNKYLQGK